MKRNKKEFRNNILVLIITLFLMLLIIELLLRAVALSPEEILEKQKLKTVLVHNNSDTYFMPVNDPRLIFNLKPNMDFRYVVFLLNGSNYTYSVTTNSEGFRDRNFSVIKPKNTFRIAVLGDSIAFGESQNLNQTFTKYLENVLKGDKIDIEVINMAVSAYTTSQEVEFFKLKGLKYKPELVIVAFCLNDPHAPTNIFEGLNQGDEPSKECKIDMIQMRIPCFIENILKKSRIIYSSKEVIKKLILNTYSHKKESESYLNIYDSYYKNESNFEYVSSAFEELNKLSQENNFSVMVVVFPIFYDLNHYQWSYAHEGVRKEAGKNDFYFLDLYDTFKDFNPKDVKSPAEYDFLHLNPKGHLIATESIQKFILENNLTRINNLSAGNS